ncbi:amino acid kinase family protein, partial [Paraprevotella clara]|uniref:amino acid kinase family protein n=1 Tax=Paraprevotella clara TaxID=454154 RepID=UPI004029E831
MKVMKFGGTSVGSAQRMKDVCRLITQDGTPNMIVLSAMSGTTNTLVEISDYLYKKNPEGANNVINQLEQKYRQLEDLYYATDIQTQTTFPILK